MKSLFAKKFRRIWIDLPLRGKGFVVVSLPIAALVTGLVLLSAMASREQAAQQWLDHTIEARTKLSAILNDLLSAESNARAYVIVGHPDLLAPLQSMGEDVKRQVKELEQLVKDNPIQRERIPSLRKLIDEKFAAITALIAAAQVDAKGSNLQLDRSRHAMEPLRAMLQRMDDEEGRLQQIRQDQLRAARSYSVIAGVATLALGFFGGLAATLLFSRSIAGRMELLRVNARALRLESSLLRTTPARDEIGAVEQEMEATSELIAKRTEKLRQSEAQLRAIIDHTTAIVYIKDLEGRYILVNPQMEEACGRSAREIIGKNCHHLFQKEFADQIAANDREVLRTGEPREFEEQILHRGRLRTYLSNKVPLLDRDGRPYALCGISADITERSRAAEQLRQARDQLQERVGRRTAELEQFGQRLEKESALHQQTAETLKQTQAQLLHAQKMEIIGQVASGVAHDFNNILTAIMGYAALLLGEPARPAEDYATEIMRAAERAATLTRQLLGFGRVQPNEQKPIALEQVVRGTESMLRRVIGDTISLRTVIERRVGTVRADPSQIEQLLLNLVVNARDAMPTGGRITIALQQRTGEKSLPNNGEQGAEWAEVSVTDEGTGIPPEVQRRMFEPFFTTKRPGQGTGLGLATCVMIAQQNHGRLEFTTAPANGTTFSLLLPCVPEPATAPRLPKEELSAPGHETLLVVEDEPAVGEIMALLLRDLGYNVITAENGEAAERAIAECEREIDLVLTDLNMPRMNGRELLERLSRNNPRVRVILTSGDQDLLDEEKEQSLEVDFLPKPFTRQGLAEKVRTVLEKETSAPSA